MSGNFPLFTSAGYELVFADKLNYLGHIIENNLTDHTNLNREVKCLYTHTNILIRQFKRCSVRVKTQLFKTYCLCLYDAATWLNFNVKSTILLQVLY